MCANALDEIDYKDVRLVQRFMNASSKIMPRRRSGSCVKHQRVISQAIKRARIMALVAFVPK